MLTQSTQGVLVGPTRLSFRKIAGTRTNYALTGENLRSQEDALAYLTECTLATVCHMAGLSKPPKGELSRQISIAQTGIDWVKTMVEPGDRYGCGRVQEIIDEGISVETWAARRRR